MSACSHMNTTAVRFWQQEHKHKLPNWNTSGNKAQSYTAGSLVCQHSPGIHCPAAVEQMLLSRIWVVLRNCAPLWVGNFKLISEGNLLLQCKYFYFLSLYVDVSDNKNNNDCQRCVVCTLNQTDVAK